MNTKNTNRNQLITGLFYILSAIIFVWLPLPFLYPAMNDLSLIILLMYPIFITPLFAIFLVLLKVIGKKIPLNIIVLSTVFALIFSVVALRLESQYSILSNLMEGNIHFEKKSTELIIIDQNDDSNTIGEETITSD